VQTVSIQVVGNKQVGQALTFTLTAMLSDGTSINPSGDVTWSSSDAHVLGFNSSGGGSATINGSAGAAGTATGSAAYKNKTASVQVVITSPAPGASIAGLWAITLPSGERGCDTSPHTYVVRVTQTGAAVSANFDQLPGGRPIMLPISHTFGGSVAGTSVRL